MTAKTVTRADLADAVIRRTGISRGLSAALVDLVFEEISAALGRGEPVKISSFAAFEVHNKRAREGRNPQTGEIFSITPRRVVSFTASQSLKSRVQEAHIDGGRNAKLGALTKHT